MNTTGRAKVWVMPVDAEILGDDGDQVWYATDDGTGSVAPVRWASSWVFTDDPDDEAEA